MLNKQHNTKCRVNSNTILLCTQNAYEATLLILRGSEVHFLSFILTSLNVFLVRVMCINVGTYIFILFSSFVFNRQHSIVHIVVAL